MDARQESAVSALIRILEPLTGEASVLVVPVGRTAALGQRVPWPLGEEGRAAARKQILEALRRLTVAASVEVWLEGQTRSRGWAVPYPEPSGLFDAEDRESKEWLRRWLTGEPGDVGENGAGPRMVIPIVAEASTPEVRVFRSNPPSADCWSDIRDLLATRNRRMTGAVIGSELSRIGLAWSSRAIDAVLAEARRAGLLDHDRAAGGFGLTDRGRGLSLNEVRRVWGLRTTEEAET